MLEENEKRTVIVCGPGAVEPKGQTLLSNFARTHPIIYVTSDIQRIQEHLRMSSVDQVSALLDRLAPTLRSVSNFEFHNLSDLNGLDSEDNFGLGYRSPRSLALKQVEYDFIHLIQSTRTQLSTTRQQQSYLSSIPVENRPFTYALVVFAPVPDALLANIRRTDILADAVELIIPFQMLCADTSIFSNSTADYISQQFYATRRNTQLPIVLHIQFQYPCTVVDMNLYFEILHHNLRLAPDFLCVNLGCDQDRIHRLVAAKGTTKILAHHYERTPPPSGWNASEWDDKIVLAERTEVDLVRLCQEASSPAENFAVRHFASQATASMKSGVPVIAYNMGSLGKMSRYLNSVLSPVADTLLEDMPHPYTSLLTVREAQSSLYASLFLDPMQFGICGDNVAQSLSPAMHNAAFHCCGMPHEYKTFQYSNLDELKAILSDAYLGGVSITAPFKSEVMSFVKYTSCEARAIGAVNTLIPLREDNVNSLLNRNRAGPVVAVYGDNTDWIAVKNCVRLNLSPINAIKRRTTALVVGAGGMARAATYALISLGVRNIFFHNRTKQRAQSLIDHFHERCSNVVASSLKMKIIEGKLDVWPENADYPTIVISCIATREVDGRSSVDTSLFSAWLASSTGGVVIELSYTPLETPLLQQARELSDQGWIAVNGLQVLPEQGKMQFELFTARKAPINLMRQEVMKAYKRKAASTRQSSLP